MTPTKRIPRKESTKTHRFRGPKQYFTTERVIIVGSLTFTIILLAALMLNSAEHTLPSLDVHVPDRSRVIPIQVSQHFGPSEAHPPYDSNPPTSGPHFPDPPQWGIYRAIFPDEKILHDLEHGGVWISYRDISDPDQVHQLEAIAGRYPNLIILTYRPANDTPIAVAAWGRLLTLDRVDAAQINNFFLRYSGKGPE